MKQFDVKPNFSEYQRIVSLTEFWIEAFRKTVQKEISLPVYYENVLRTIEVGLPEQVALGCLSDTHRTKKLAVGIVDSLISFSYRYGTSPAILDIGAGTGILSFIAYKVASELGMNPRVTAIEVEAGMAELARSSFGKVGAKDIELICCDGRMFSSHISGPIDIVISENLYTGMFEEHQLQMVDHVHKHNAKFSDFSRDVFFVPRAVSLSVYAAQTHVGLNEPLSVQEMAGSQQRLSEDAMYYYVSFADMYRHVICERDSITCETELKILKAGELNSMVVRMTTMCGYDCKSYILPNSGSSLGVDQIFPVEPTSVEPNCSILVLSSYMPGVAMSNVLFSILCFRGLD